MHRKLVHSRESKLSDPGPLFHMVHFSDPHLLHSLPFLDPDIIITVTKQSTSNAHLKKLTVLISPASDKSSPSIKLLVLPPHAESCVPANEKCDVARGDRLEVVRIHVGDAVPGVSLGTVLFRCVVRRGHVKD